MRFVKVFLLFFVCIHFSDSLETSEDSSQEFLQWCNEELQSFQETEFALPDTLPDVLHGILKQKLDNFDLTEVCQFVVEAGFDKKVDLKDVKDFWTQFRQSFPMFYCNMCDKMESKIKTTLLSKNNSLEDMISDIVDDFPDDARTDLLLRYKKFFTENLQTKLTSESMCRKALPKCSQDFAVKSNIGSIFKNITECLGCSFCETLFIMLDYDVLQSPELYHWIYNLTQFTICPAFNFTIGTMNGYTFCLTILDDLAQGILSIINFYLNPYTMCYKEWGICDPTVFTNDLLTCMCTGVTWPKSIEKFLCPDPNASCDPMVCSGCQY